MAGKSCKRCAQTPACSDDPIIVCSVLREHDLALALGANDTLVKPVSQPAVARGAAALAGATASELGKVAEQHLKQGQQLAQCKAGRPPDADFPLDGRRLLFHAAHRDDDDGNLGNSASAVASSINAARSSPASSSPQKSHRDDACAPGSNLRRRQSTPARAVAGATARSMRPISRTMWGSSSTTSASAGGWGRRCSTRARSSRKTGLGR